ncbi:hypothetical protein FACS18948_2230 [Clostridia bacterium]|nr:hypothetical protein FACS18948_2230 [Clostridia bacterium]
MFEYIGQNLGTIAVGLIVAGIVAAIIAKLVRDKKKGKHIGCDCDCGECSLKGGCHKER